MSARLTLALASCLVLLACEPQRPSCGPQTCNGCCQADDVCVEGSSPFSCGTAGLRCDVCVASQQCMAGACTSPAGGGSATGGGLATGGGTATGGGGSAAGGGGGGGGGSTCQPENDATLCNRTGTRCGAQTLVDSCGTNRTISCGTCSAPSTCSAGQCVCVAETTPQFCARVGRSCGPATALDNCGMSRSVASCGTCTATQTCSSAGQCACTPETTVAF